MESAFIPNVQHVGVNVPDRLNARYGEHVTMGSSRANRTRYERPDCVVGPFSDFVGIASSHLLYCFTLSAILIRSACTQPGLSMSPLGSPQSIS